MNEPRSVSPRETTAERTRGGPHLTPRVDIFESEQELTLLAEMPGVRPEDVDLQYDRGELVVHGRPRRREPAGPTFAREFEVGDYYRVFQIHESIDHSRIEAACKNGVLTVRLPKLAASQPRQVKVRNE
jgi:HSP20 family protein